MQIFKTTTLVVFILLTLFAVGRVSYAARVDELQSSIANKNKEIANIEQEIAEYQRQLDDIGAEKQSLQGAIQTLDVARKKLLTDIRLTEQKIEGTTLNIEKLNIEIAEKERLIAQNSGAIGETLRRINETDNQTLVETVLSYNNLSDFWDEVESLQRFQVTMREDLSELRALKQEFLGQKDELEGTKQTLSQFRGELSDQKQVVEYNKREKDELLAVTKNKEANYQTLLEEKIAKRAAFEEELRQFEEALRIEIDPSSIPVSRSGILAWPVDDVFITQYFGNTEFATKNPQVYNGGGHNGIDLRAPTGAKIRSALSGVVEGVGDTDTVCPNASYGKWVLVRHNNGLSTLYAHLSFISVRPGQLLGTREVVGYSGNSGYSTGPHLHFTVFATQGVRISQLKSRVCGGTYTLPLADRKAYLNPLSYL